MRRLIQLNHPRTALICCSDINSPDAELETYVNPKHFTVAANCKYAPRQAGLSAQVETVGPDTCGIENPSRLKICTHLNYCYHCSLLEGLRPTTVQL